MLATYRCNEIKDQALAHYEKEFTNFNKNTNNGLMSNFRLLCEDLSKKVLEIYDETAKNYFERIYKEVREQLNNYMLNQFYVGFTNQGRILLPLSQKNLKKDIDSQLIVNENFSEVVDKLKTTHLGYFVKFMKEIQLSEHWDLNMNSVVEIFEDIIANSRKIRLDEKKKEQIVKIFLILEKN